MRTGIYKHYKGGYYQVLGIGEHTETGERMVVYIALTGIHLPGPRMRIRPLVGPEGWNTPVIDVLSNVMERFVYVGDSL